MTRICLLAGRQRPLIAAILVAGIFAAACDAGPPSNAGPEIGVAAATSVATGAIEPRSGPAETAATMPPLAQGAPAALGTPSLSPTPTQLPTAVISPSPTPSATAEAPTPTPTPTPSLLERAKRSAKDALLKLVPDWKAEGRINILLVGIDKQDSARGNTDVMIVASVDPSTSSAMLLSVPRHICIGKCDTAADRLNAVHAREGPDGLKREVADLLGIPIDFYAAVNFNGFAEAVDMLGGLDMWVERDFDEVFEFLETREELRLRLSAGWHRLNGREALLIVRSRKFDPGGDYARICRQQLIVRRLREEAVSLRLVPRIPQFLTRLGGWFATDFPGVSIPSFAELVAGIPNSRIHSFALTAQDGLVEDFTGSEGAQLSRPNREKIRSYVEAALLGSISERQGSVSAHCVAPPPMRSG